MSAKRPLTRAEVERIRDDVLGRDVPPALGDFRALCQTALDAMEDAERLDWLEANLITTRKGIDDTRASRVSSRTAPPRAVSGDHDA